MELSKITCKPAWIVAFRTADAAHAISETTVFGFPPAREEITG